MTLHRFLLSLLASASLLLTGCKDPNGSSGGTSGAALYTFDTATNQVLVWKNLSTLYEGSSTATPSFVITSTLFSKVSGMAWGGLCFDSSRGILYMVSDTGTIVRVTNIRTQTGAVPNAEVVSFGLASTGRLTNGKFGQVALDAQNNLLYITESGDNATQIWVVPSASAQIQDATIALQALQMSSDTGGTGVAAASGTVYAFMLDGGTVGTDALTGPRLRRGTNTAFNATDVIVGSKTTLGKYGSLALDTANSYLFVARHNTDAVATSAPVLAFRTGQFGLTYNQAPTMTLGSVTAQANLRVLAHAGSKDWLVGLSGDGSTGYATIHIWKSPLGGTAAKTITVSTTPVLKGLAIDGNAS